MQLTSNRSKIQSKYFHQPSRSATNSSLLRNGYDCRLLMTLCTLVWKRTLKNYQEAPRLPINLLLRYRIHFVPAVNTSYSTFHIYLSPKIIGSKWLLITSSRKTTSTTLRRLTRTNGTSRFMVEFKRIESSRPIRLFRFLTRSLCLSAMDARESRSMIHRLPQSLILKKLYLKRLVCFSKSILCLIKGQFQRVVFLCRHQTLMHLKTRYSWTQKAVKP
jgi:hypothetical protein